MGYLCALLLTGTLCGLGEKEDANWTGLIHRSAAANLAGKTDVKLAGTSFAYGIITSAKAMADFADAAAPRTGLASPKWNSWRHDIDWKNDAVICVIRTAPTNRLLVQSWRKDKDGAGVLKLQFHAIEPYYFYGTMNPAIFYRVAKKNLKTISIHINMDGWRNLGTINLEKK